MCSMHGISPLKVFKMLPKVRGEQAQEIKRYHKLYNASIALK